MKNFWLKRREDRLKSTVVIFEVVANIRTGRGQTVYRGELEKYWLLEENSDKLWMETRSQPLITFFDAIIKGNMWRTLRPEGILKVFEKGGKLLETWGLPYMSFPHIHIGIYSIEVKINSFMPHRTINSEYIKLDPAL